ncbi:MAG: leucine-rich repeat domain-containing protein [Clostridia bacterium]|nr:leucine-rich repeat domain-containing protein [Clostridia bacterium]
MRLMRKISALALVAVFVLAFFVACNGEKKNAENKEPKAPAYTEGLVFVADSEGCFVSGYTGDTADVVIPDEYGGYKVVRIDGSAFAGKNHITSVTLGDNVKKVGAAAFAGCENLKTVDLGASLEELGSAAFFGCSALEEVTLSAGVKTIGIDCFAGCEGLEKIIYSGNQSLWSHVRLGANNEFIEEKLSLSDGGNFVKIIAQGECNANITWRVGNDGVLIVTGEGHIPDYTFDKIPWREYNQQILGIVVEDGIDVIGKNAFLGCINARTASIAESVRLIDNAAFSRCSSLEEIVLPSRLRRLGDDVFLGCEGLKVVAIPDSVTAMGSGVFMDCTALESVKLSSAITEVGRWSFANCPSLKEIDLSGVTVVGSNAFFRCEGLNKVIFSGATAEIGDNAFLGCPRFTKVGTIPATAVIGTGNNGLR